MGYNYEVLHFNCAFRLEKFGGLGVMTFASYTFYSVYQVDCLALVLTGGPQKSSRSNLKHYINQGLKTRP